jgi:hypothetical protein
MDGGNRLITLKPGTTMTAGLGIARGVRCNILFGLKTKSMRDEVYGQDSAD